MLFYAMPRNIVGRAAAPAGSGGGGGRGGEGTGVLNRGPLSLNRSRPPVGRGAAAIKISAASATPRVLYRDIRPVIARAAGGLAGPPHQGRLRGPGDRSTDRRPDLHDDKHDQGASSPLPSARPHHRQLVAWAIA
eukprot:scaffold1410_cov386-Prasinococcus_capsulatus_cf.AAC.11